MIAGRPRNTSTYATESHRSGPAARPGSWRMIGDDEAPDEHEHLGHDEDHDVEDEALEDIGEAAVMCSHEKKVLPTSTRPFHAFQIAKPITSTIAERDAANCDPAGGPGASARRPRGRRRRRPAPRHGGRRTSATTPSGSDDAEPDRASRCRSRSARRAATTPPATTRARPTPHESTSARAARRRSWASTFRDVGGSGRR